MRRPLLSLAVKSVALAGVFCLASLPALADMVLERVVLVQRHGVRAPTQSPEALASWTARQWPSWPVGRGELTPRGAQVVGLMADGIRAGYVAQGLLPATGCPGDSLVIWADGADERTRDSGRMLADRLAPGCAAPLGHGPDGQKDKVFDSTGGACRLEDKAARKAVAAFTGNKGIMDPAAAEAIRRVWSILKPGEAPGPSSFKVTPGGITISGALSVAAQVSEIFLLQYAENMPVADVGWGAAADPAVLAVLLPARDRLADLSRRLPYLARRQGAAMARIMLATLAGETRAAAPAIGPGVKVLAFAGHDDDISNMAGIFGVNWSLPRQPDTAPPAAAFALERWRDTTTGAVLVGATVWYAELEGMRALDPARVRSLKVPLPGCGESGLCPLDALRAQALKDIPAACGGG